MWTDISRGLPGHLDCPCRFGEVVRLYLGHYCMFHPRNTLQLTKICSKCEEGLCQTLTLLGLNLNQLEIPPPLTSSAMISSIVLSILEGQM
jgi:hypothetical protein